MKNTMRNKLHLLVICVVLTALNGCNVFDTDSVKIQEYTRELTTANLEVTENRDADLMRLLMVMNRPSQNSAILLGAPGSGKSTLVYEFARRVQKGNIYPKFKNKKVVQINLGQVKQRVPASKQIFNVQYIELIERAIKHYGKGHVYFIDELQDMLAEPNLLGARFTDLLKSLLDDNSYVIFATTVDEFRKTFLDPALIRRMAPLFIEEMNVRETADVLMKFAPAYQKQYGQDLNYALAQKAASLAIKLYEYAAPQFYARQILEFALTQCENGKLTDTDLIQAAADKLNMSIDEVYSKMKGEDPNTVIAKRNEQNLSVLRVMLLDLIR